MESCSQSRENKTKVDVFCKGGKIHITEKWFYDNVEKKVVDKFIY